MLHRVLLTNTKGENKQGADKSFTDVKGKSITKDAPTGKDTAKGKQKNSEALEEVPNESEGVDPQDAGCEVTDFELQSMLLVGSYKGLDTLV